MKKTSSIQERIALHSILKHSKLTFKQNEYRRIFKTLSWFRQAGYKIAETSAKTKHLSPDDLEVTFTIKLRMKLPTLIPKGQFSRIAPGGSSRRSP